MRERAAVQTSAADLKPWLVEVRRDFHRHPELGLAETRTRGKIAHYLEEMGIPYETGIAETGVVGYIQGGKKGKTVALRADMDALPIEEENAVAYKSLYPGKMHACGHDAHMAVLLGAAKLLNERKADLPGCVKLIFQPAEETVGGAKRMIAEGVLEKPRVDGMFGLHVAPEMPVGDIGVKDGQMNASSDTIRITVHGQQAHGAYPHKGQDAIVIAAQVITALQTIVSRNVDPREAAVISIGTIEGGTQGNIIAGEVRMTGTVRTFDAGVRDTVLKRVEDVLAHTTYSMGGDYTFTLGDDGYIALVNDDAMVDIVRKSGEQLLGAEHVQEITMPSMGVEDFSYFADSVPAAFYRLGCRNEAKGIVHGAHTGRFDIDEDCLPLGAALQVQNVLHFLAQER